MSYLRARRIQSSRPMTVRRAASCVQARQASARGVAQRLGTPSGGVRQGSPLGGLTGERDAVWHADLAQPEEIS